MRVSTGEYLRTLVDADRRSWSRSSFSHSFSFWLSHWFSDWFSEWFIVRCTAQWFGAYCVTMPCDRVKWVKMED